MTSATARMESPTLIPTSDSAGKGEDGKVVIAEVDNSKKGEQSLQPLKILAAATSVISPSSGITTTASRTSPSSTKSPPSPNANDGEPISSSEVDEIDSALLAALRDPRERLGLLKLEQSLIDFLEKQPQDPHVDIGGPYNSTVISPTLGYIGQQPQQLQAAAQPQPDGTNAGRPQTTFQRCILHRICDRFNMTRENSYTTDAYGCYLIRVCKGSGSKKPPRRLLNVKESEYQIPRPSLDNTSVNAGSNVGHQLSTNFQQMNISSTTSTNSSGGTVGSSPPVAKGSTKLRKMKIMKRSSSNVSNGSGGSNNSKSKNNTIKMRSSLSEKEKKYAEARARIFEQEEGSRSGNRDQSVTASSYNNNQGTTAVPVPPSNNRVPPGNYYNNNKINSNSDIHGGHSYSERRAPYNINANASSYNPNWQTSQSPSPSSSASASASGNPKAPLHNNSTTSLNSMASNNSGKGNNSDGDQQQSTTARSKATYRNRQQEETDPDFRRGAGIQLQTNPYAHANTAVGYGATSGGRGGGNVYYPNNAVAANGNNNRAGYGYSQQQQHYQYHQQQQQHYSSQQHHQAPYYPNNNTAGGLGYTHSNNMQYQQQRRQQEQHYPALSSSTTRK